MEDLSTQVPIHIDKGASDEQIRDYFDKLKSENDERMLKLAKEEVGCRVEGDMIIFPEYAGVEAMKFELKCKNAGIKVIHEDPAPAVQRVVSGFNNFEKFMEDYKKSAQ